MLPPLGVGVSASVETAAPLLINKYNGETVIERASPLPVDLAVIWRPRSGSTMCEDRDVDVAPAVRLNF